MKLLSEEDLKREIQAAYLHAHPLEKLQALINSQKIAHGEYVIGENDFDQFDFVITEAEAKKLDEIQIRSALRDTQRKRNTL